MIEQKNKLWYVERRGLLAAQQFLLELGATYFPVEEDFGLDYMAFFRKEDGTTIVAGIEVKAVEREINKKISLPSSSIKRLLKISIPVLILVVDVKDNTIYFNWMKDAISPDQESILSDTTTQSVKLRLATQEERERLKQEVQFMH